MWSVLIFCHPFFNSEIRKLIAKLTFCLSCSSSIPTCPTTCPMHNTFFSWNFTVALISSTFSGTNSASWMGDGNFPILFRVLPKSLGNCFIRLSDANKVLYGLAQALIGFLSLLNFLSPSTSMQSIPAFFAWSQWTAVPMIQIWFRNEWPLALVLECLATWWSRRISYLFLDRILWDRLGVPHFLGTFSVFWWSPSRESSPWGNCSRFY